jgi:hypothetical protein
VEYSLNQIVAEKARQWEALKVPYRHRGVTQRGCDCTGLLLGILLSLGYRPNGWKLRPYSMDWNVHTGAGNYILDELSPVTTKVSLSTALPGDILTFRLVGECVGHVGVLTDNVTTAFVHQHVNAKHCKRAILKNSGWGRHLAGVYRFDEQKLAQFL